MANCFISASWEYRKQTKITWQTVVAIKVLTQYKGQVVLVHIRKVYRGSGGVAAVILNVGIR
jgi:hypothetical protein